MRFSIQKLAFASSCLVMALVGCGSAQQDHSSIAGNVDLSSAITDNDYQIITEKRNLFEKNSKSHANCGVGIAAKECIVGLDKLLELSTTSLFPTNRFYYIHVGKNFTNTDTSGFLDIDYKASVAEVKKHLEGQDTSYVRISEKKGLFEKNSKSHTSCGVGIAAKECLVGLDKLLELSTTSLFPTNRFYYIHVGKNFTNADTSGFLDIDYNASVAEIEKHLKNQ